MCGNANETKDVRPSPEKSSLFFLTVCRRGLPEKVIPNSYFSDHEFFSKEGIKIRKPAAEVIAKLEEISGITSRRYISDQEDNVPMIKAAGENAIADAGLNKTQIDGIIVAHNTGNMVPDNPGHWDSVPNLASLAKNILGIKNHECFAYDILFGCPGWVQGLIQAHQAIQNGDANHVLVIGVEVISRVLDPHDLDSMLLGDGCGAVILSKSERDNKAGVLGYATFSHCQEDCHTIYIGKSNNPDFGNTKFFKMNGREVYRYATKWVPQVIKKGLEKVGKSMDEVDLFLFHQANGKMIEAIGNNISRLFDVDFKVLKERIPITIGFTGNTSVASIPTMLDMIRNKQLDKFEIKDGQLVAMVSVGAGMHCNAILYQF